MTRPRDELDAAHLGVDHVVHCVAARTADAYHADAGESLDLGLNAFRHT